METGYALREFDRRAFAVVRHLDVLDQCVDLGRLLARAGTAVDDRDRLVDRVFAPPDLVLVAVSECLAEPRDADVVGVLAAELEQPVVVAADEQRYVALQRPGLGEHGRLGHDLLAEVGDAVAREQTLDDECGFDQAA